MVEQITWADVRHESQRLANRQAHHHFTSVYGVPTGGAPVAVMVADLLCVPLAEEPAHGSTLVVDDLVDSGATLSRYRAQGMFVDALYRKPYSPTNIAPDATLRDAWLTFPWERDDGDPTDAVVRLLQHIGEDPTRDGLVDTPRRVVKALREMTSGYGADVEAILGTVFQVDHDEMIVVSGMPFWSLCEHHMLPFHGLATVGYIPGARRGVVGLSKLARLLDAFARRLQVQERLTDQICHAIEEHLRPLGAGVIISGSHSCMCARGVSKHGTMTTSSLRGVLLDRPQARAEFLAMSHLGTSTDLRR